MPHHRTCLVVLSLLAFLVLAPAPCGAAQSTDTCAGFIDSLPATISTQGVWCLRHDLSTAITSGNAIEIAANNVTIDCNDFKLGGLAGGADTHAVGIYASNRLNATVRRCNIRGFQGGIWLTGASGGGHVVEDNRLQANREIGLGVEGDGSVVRHNRVSDTASSMTNVYGIYTVQTVDVIDNTVSGVLAGYTAYGIYSVSSNGSISGNRVRGLGHPGAGATRGITSGAGVGSLRSNDVSGDGSAGSLGLYCFTYANSVRASNNIVNGFVQSNFNCIDAGGNSL